MSEVLKALVAGVERPIYVVRTAEEARAAAAEIRGRGQCETVCFDTETTGLEIYQEGFRVRLVQFGTKEAAWVFVVEDSEEVDTEACGLLLGLPSLVAHNASFDIRSLRLPLWDTTTDTYLMAHLLDPREKVDGGPGFSLEELSAEYFDADALAYKDALFDRFRELGFKRTRADGWGGAYSEIPNTDEAYLRYAGVDVLLGSWLHSALFPLIVSKGQETLLAYEMVLAEICAGMMDRGFQVDAEYMERLGPELSARAEAARKVAACYGVENVNSTSQVADALLALEAPLVEKTRTGKWKVDKEVLEGLVASEGRWAPLAQAVMDAKTLEGFRVKYVQKVLDRLDSEGRVHADIRSLKARTARMAVANPPLQQLPSRDYLIRRGFVARPGCVIVAVDLNQVELVVLAALCQDRAMVKAIQEGQDLHQVTADGAKTSRRVGKMANFLMVYGGGAKKLAVQAGISLADAKRVVAGYHRTFPGVKRYSRRIMDRAERGQRWVTTPVGRRIPMDRDRSYAGLNYEVQSLARDVMGQALIRMKEAGIDQYLVMVVHDEALAEVPLEVAEEVVTKMEECMTFRDFLGAGVDITAGGEVYGSSWGHGYGATE